MELTHPLSLASRFRNAVLGIFDLFSKGALVESGTDVGRAWLTASVPTHPHCVLSGWGQVRCCMWHVGLWGSHSHLRCQPLWCLRRQPECCVAMSLCRGCISLPVCMWSHTNETKTPRNTDRGLGYREGIRGNSAFSKANTICQVHTSCSCVCVCVLTTTHTHTFLGVRCTCVREGKQREKTEQALSVFWCQPWWMGNRNIWFAIVTREISLHYWAVALFPGTGFDIVEISHDSQCHWKSNEGK